MLMRVAGYQALCNKFVGHAQPSNKSRLLWTWIERTAADDLAAQNRTNYGFCTFL